MKKMLSALMSLSLLAGVAAMPVSAAETYSLGDVDMNGVVDTRDASLALEQYVTNLMSIVAETEFIFLSSEQIALADVWQADHTFAVITSVDAQLICAYYIYDLVHGDMTPEEYFASNLWENNVE